MATTVTDRVGNDVVGFADRAEDIGEVGAELRVISQYLPVPQRGWHHDAIAIGVPRFAGKAFVGGLHPRVSREGAAISPRREGRARRSFRSLRNLSGERERGPGDGAPLTHLLVGAG